MSDIYTGLLISPKKRRPQDTDDGSVLTPKKLRTVPPTPPKTRTRREAKELGESRLPDHLSRLITIFTSLQHALSHALATCAVSPSQETGVVRNVLNHLSLATYTGLDANIDADDLLRLCWVWEWDGQSLPDEGKADPDVEDNPFLDAPTTSSATSSSTEWVRGAMGFVISPGTHYLKSDRRRVPAYGVGIEVEVNVDKDMKGGMAAVARWTAAADKRRVDFRMKLHRWAELHKQCPTIPNVPRAKLPSLPTTAKMSALTRTLISGSPKASTLLSMPYLPSSPSKSFPKSPKKHLKKDDESLPSAILFPEKSPAKNTVVFPQTPSRKRVIATAKTPLTPSTPSSLPHSAQSRPATPVHQRGSDSCTAPQTPTTSRRQALYERVRQRSLSTSPTKVRGVPDAIQSSMTRDEIQKLGQEETRRRCLLGRLNGVAESIWMLFSAPGGMAGTSTSSRKRKALPASEVTAAIITSSPVPISVADADDSITMLTKLCPFFLRKLELGDEDWLEMPGPNLATSNPSPKKKLTVPSSPGAARTKDSAEELVRRSPRSVKKEMGGLREVREMIRREIELQD